MVLGDTEENAGCGPSPPVLSGSDGCLRYPQQCVTGGWVSPPYRKATATRKATTRVWIKGRQIGANFDKGTADIDEAAWLLV